MNIKEIYYLTDFSEASEKALWYAADLVKKAKGHLHIVHVYEKPYITIAQSGALSAVVDSELDEKIRVELRQQLKDFLAKHKKWLEGGNYRLFDRLVADVPVYKFYEPILDEGRKIDIAVIGTRGATGIFHGELLGTNAARLLRYAPFPVLIVPADVEPTPIKRILFADGGNDDHTQVFQVAKELAKLYEAEIILTYIETTPDPYLKQHAKQREEQYKEVYPNVKTFIMRYPSVVEGLIEATITKEADLLVMPTHGRKGLKRFIKGSITEQVVQHLYVCPTLAIKIA